MRDTIDMAREVGYMRTVHGGAEISMASMDCLKAFEALVRADERALAAPVQGYTTTRASWTGSVTHTCNTCGKNDFRSEHSAMAHKCEAPAAQPAPVQEPVGKIESSDFGNCVQFFSGKMPPVGSWLYTTPPAAQRQWVGLTDEDIAETDWHLSANREYEQWTLQEQLVVCGVKDFARAIEAKLKEKNT